jgi:outer membrane protein, heavy metal efflux system
LIGDVRAMWAKLYVLRKQVEIAETDKQQVQSLIDTANARIATGDAQPGDVLMATLELSNLEEQLLDFHQQIVATIAELNRLVGRDPRVPITLPDQIDAELPDWDHDLLRDVALQYQPEVIAARLQTEATRWGIEVARLQRRPDVSLGAGWMPMAADPADTMPGAGNDAWTLGFMVNVPLWHEKYNAMYAEASREHRAARASEEGVALRIEALLRELWQQAHTAQRTAELYETTILPQARQTLASDLQSLAHNTVTFDRVIRNHRSLLNLELGYHRARGQLATSLARIRQALGVDLVPAEGR